MIRLIPKVMDCKTQQHKLLPLLAAVFAFFTTGEYIIALNEQATTQFDNNLFDLLPEVRQFIMHYIMCWLHEQKGFRVAEIIMYPYTAPCYCLRS